IDQRVDLLRESPRKAPRRRARSSRRRGVDQIRDRFGLREIELAIQERAARELAWLGDPRAEIETAVKQQSEHRGAPVAVQLEHRFAGIRRGRWKIERDSTVEWLAHRAAQGRERRGAGRRWRGENGRKPAGDVRNRKQDPV